MRRGKKSVIKEHKTEVEATTIKPFTRSRRLSSLSKQNKSALTDHASQCDQLAASTVLDRESDRSTRWIKEAVHIWNEGQRSMNWDEGSYILSHTYDRFLARSHHYLGKNRKNWASFFRRRPLIETGSSKVKGFGWCNLSYKCFINLKNIFTEMTWHKRLGWLLITTSGHIWTKTMLGLSRSRAKPE